ncbi:MAG: cell wall-binding repeat-containing protein, partial [Coriobacteriales bacterium]|nr:cell wall-binding repeat-containing protein [Coriobacteriales bacterium]
SSIVADYCVKQGALDYTHLCVARGDDFPDALSMGPLCGKAGAALMLSYPDSDYYGILSQIQNNYTGMQTCYVAGGTASISNRIFNQFEDTISMPENCPYICFISEESKGATIGLLNGYANTIHLQVNYSDPTNAGAWSNIDVDSGSQVNLNKLAYGKKVYLRGTNDCLGTGYIEQSFRFVLKQKVSCVGDVRALIDYEKIAIGQNPTLSDWCFACLFCGGYNLEGNWNDFTYYNQLLTAPMLKATNLSKGCYNWMFAGCNVLKQSPKLPATTVPDSAYRYMHFCDLTLGIPGKISAQNVGNYSCEYMFSECLNLNQCPDFSITSVGESGCNWMFEGTAISTTPDLSQASLAKSCFDSMFLNCKSLRFVCDLPQTNLAESCYSSMFSSCKSLTSRPNLPATTLAKSCYNGMFSRTSLSDAGTLPATVLAQNCYGSMFSSCEKLTTAPQLPVMNLEDSCYRNMFGYCTSLTQAPVLPATTLKDGCYWGMFSGCTSLVQAPDLPATILVSACYRSMFENCKNLSTFPNMSATQLGYMSCTDMCNGCSKISSVTVKFTSWLPNPPASSTNTCYNWLKGTAANGTFYCPTDLSEIHDSEHIPVGWSVQRI